MKNKTLIIALTLSIASLTACTDKKKIEEKLEKEIITEENKAAFKEDIEKVAKRKLDSIRQVKEHGHAH